MQANAGGGLGVVCRRAESTTTRRFDHEHVIAPHFHFGARSQFDTFRTTSAGALCITANEDIAPGLSRFATSQALRPHQPVA